MTEHKITADDMRSAADKASAFAGRLSQISSLFTLESEGPPSIDPIEDAMAFQRLATTASLMASLVMSRHWRAQRLVKSVAARRGEDSFTFDQSPRGAA